MGKISIAIVGLVLFGAVKSSCTARADLLVNGSFDTFATSGTGITPGHALVSPFGPYYTYDGGTPGLTGWNVLGPSIDVNSSSYWQTAPGGGTASLDLAGTDVHNTGAQQLGGVSQTVTGLTAGQTYKLDFWHSVNPGNDQFNDGTKPKILDVAVFDATSNPLALNASGAAVTQANNHVQYTLTTGTRTDANMQWIEDFVTFKAPTSSITVQFSTVANPNSSLTVNIAGPALDLVSLVQVPEPASLSLLALGGLLLTRQRSRNP
jgi:PEP-CTERM motif